MAVEIRFYQHANMASGNKRSEAASIYRLGRESSIYFAHEMMIACWAGDDNGWRAALNFHAADLMSIGVIAIIMS